MSVRKNRLSLTSSRPIPRLVLDGHLHKFGSPSCIWPEGITEGGRGSVGSQRKSDVLGERLLTRRWSLALHNLPLQDLTNDYRVRIRGVGKTGRANEYDSQ